eukprot:CFRG3737T1
MADADTTKTMLELYIATPLFFRGPVILLMFLALWGVNVYVFELFGVNYTAVLNIREDQKMLWDEIVTASVSGLLIVSAALGIYSNMVNSDSILVDIIPVVTTSLLVYFFFSRRARYYSHARRWLHSVLFKCIFPGDRISFAEVFIADGLTSLSKVFADFEMIVCFVAYHIRQWTVHDATPGCFSSLFLPLIVSVPYLIRLRQCLIEYRAVGLTKDMVNALKYTSALPAIWLGHVLKTQNKGTDSPLYQGWILASIINTIYTYYWDLVWDWGLFDQSSSYFPLRPSMLYPKITYYVWIIVDLVLRCVWSVQLSNLVHLSTAQRTLLFEFLEIFRRSLWNIIRVEYECIKTNSQIHVKESISLDVGSSILVPNMTRRASGGAFTPLEMSEINL